MLAELLVPAVRPSGDRVRRCDTQAQSPITTFPVTSPRLIHGGWPCAGEFKVSIQAMVWSMRGPISASSSARCRLRPLFRRLFQRQLPVSPLLQRCWPNSLRREQSSGSMLSLEF